MYGYDTAKEPLPELSDRALIEQILSGDQWAFEYLVYRYHTSLYSFIYRRLRDYELTCDVLQLVWLQLYVSMSSVYQILATPRAKVPLRSWLFQVAYNKCMDELRKKHPLLFSEVETLDEEEAVSLLESIPDPGEALDEIAEQHELQARLRQAIQELPSKFRSVVYLRYTQELTFVEIGRMLNIPENTAKTYFQRARPLLRAALAPLISGVLSVSGVQIAVAS